MLEERIRRRAKDKSIFYRRGIRYKRYVSFDPLGAVFLLLS